MDDSDSGYALVVSIDFGATYSGYSLSFRNKPYDVFTPTTWGEVVGIAGSTKTPTCVLTDGNSDLIAIGYKAQKLFSEMDSEEARCHRFYSHFKIKLYTESNLTKNSEIEDQSGNKAPAFDIYARFIKGMKLEMLEAVKCLVASFDVNLIRWVLPVPAICTDGAKHFMREAAVKAGLVDNIDSGNLLLVPASQAASLYCQQLPPAGFAVNQGQSTQLSPGNQHLVLDIGGGTTVITAHKILPDNQLETVYSDNGSAIGGNRVNDNLLKLLDEIFEDQFLGMFRLRYPSDYISLMSRLESVKRGFHQADHGPVRFSLTLSMADLYQEEFGKRIPKSISVKYTEQGVVFKNGQLKIPHAVMMAVFKPVVDDIVCHVDEILQKDELHGITTILMVGGFSRCTVLQEAIKTKFTKYSVLAPKEAASAVMMGAVQYGHQPGATSV